MRTLPRGVTDKEPRDIGKKHPGKTYLPRFLDSTTLASLKASVDRELADISNHFEQDRQTIFKIVPGSEYMGTWDAATLKYPEATINSTWDVIVSTGASVDFDGKTWVAGQQLIYVASQKVYIQRMIPGIEDLQRSIEKNTADIAAMDTQYKKEDEKLRVSIESNKENLVRTNLNVSNLQKHVGILDTKWTIQTDASGNVSGIERVEGDLKSNFNILTTKFKVTDGTVVTQPFVIEGTDTTMPDVKVFAQNIIGDVIRYTDTTPAIGSYTEDTFHNIHIMNVPIGTLDAKRIVSVIGSMKVSGGTAGKLLWKINGATVATFPWKTTDLVGTEYNNVNIEIPSTPTATNLEIWGEGTGGLEYDISASRYIIYKGDTAISSVNMRAATSSDPTTIEGNYSHLGPQNPNIES